MQNFQVMAENYFWPNIKALYIEHTHAYAYVTYTVYTVCIYNNVYTQTACNKMLILCMCLLIREAPPSKTIAVVLSPCPRLLWVSAMKRCHDSVHRDQGEMTY